jgi:hypothetical protein
MRVWPRQAVAAAVGSVKYIVDRMRDEVSTAYHCCVSRSEAAVAGAT